MPTSLCNMCCAYCGQANCALRFNDSLTDRIEQRIIAAANEEGTRNIEIRWYGGEPMMGYHRILDISHAVIPQILKNDKSYRSTMSTNGSLMTASRLRRLYDECYLRSVTITIDGYGRDHDNSRRMRSGRPTYDLITKWLADASHSIECIPELHIAIRINVSITNYQSIHTLIDDLSRRGVACPNTELEFIPVYD